MINNNQLLHTYLEGLIANFFKIIPLYEEKNEGLKTYVESLIGNLSELERVVHLTYSHEYITLLTTLSYINQELNQEVPKKSVIKREVFKGINIIKNTISKLEEGD